jgi:hypothetical protein
MIGAILAYQLAKTTSETRSADWRSVAGMALIGAAIVVTRGQMHFPGWWALLPTLGAACVIAAGADGWFNRLLLRQPFLVAIGLISYPLYLWHHVLLTFARITGAPSPAMRIGLVGLSFVLAWLTYTLIERPFRFGRVHARTAIPLAGMIIAGVLGFTVLSAAGVPRRAYPQRFESYARTAVRMPRLDACFEIPFAHTTKGDWFCRLGQPGAKEAAFAFGDSHAASLLPLFERYALDHNVEVLFAGTSGCPPLVGVQSLRDPVDMRQHDCRALNQRIVDYVRGHSIPLVFLAARWTYYTGGNDLRPDEIDLLTTDTSTRPNLDSSRRAFESGLQQTLSLFKQIGTRVVLFDDSPQQRLFPRQALRRSRLTDESINKFAVRLSEHRAIQRWTSDLLAKYAGAGNLFLNFDDVLCDNQICPIAKDGKLLYFDDDHLSIDGSLLLYPKLNRRLSGGP